MTASRTESSSLPVHETGDARRRPFFDREAAGRVVVELIAPFYGERQVVVGSPGQSYHLGFDVTGVTPSLSGPDFVLYFDHDGDGRPDAILVIEDLLLVARVSDRALMPDLIVGRVVIPADQLMEKVLVLAAREDRADAVNALGLSSGGTCFGHNLGSIIDLLQTENAI